MTTNPFRGLLDALIPPVAALFIVLAFYLAGFYVVAYLCPMDHLFTWKGDDYPELRPMIREALSNGYLSPYEQWKIDREYDRLRAQDRFKEWETEEAP